MAFFNILNDAQEQLRFCPLSSLIGSPFGSGDFVNEERSGSDPLFLLTNALARRVPVVDEFETLRLLPHALHSFSAPHVVQPRLPAWSPHGVPWEERFTPRLHVNSPPHTLFTTMAPVVSDSRSARLTRLEVYHWFRAAPLQWAGRNPTQTSAIWWTINGVELSRLARSTLSKL